MSLLKRVLFLWCLTLIFFSIIFCYSASANNFSLPWLKVNKLKIVNEKNQVVLLNGLNLSNNVWGNWAPGTSEALQAQGYDPLIHPLQQDAWVLTESDFQCLTSLKPKVVRYAINYDLFLPDNKFRDLNISRLRQHIARFAKAGIYVIVSLHLPPGLNGENDNYERNKPPAQRLQSLFENEEYFQQTVVLWQYLAQNLKDLPAVAGYSLYNEPRLPSQAEGGLPNYQDKQNELIQAIRAIDHRHIIFVAGYNSLEKNPGEQYWQEDKLTHQWIPVEDQGEQAIAWERGFVKANDNNVVYVFSLYDPYNYTSLGEGDFDPAKVEKEVLEPKISWAKTVGKAPLLICEYGVCRSLKDMEKRLKYLQFVHNISRKHGISAIFWEYKSLVGAFIKPGNIFGLYGEYLNRDQEITSANDGSYSYQSWAEKPAKDNDFDQLFRSYFYKKPSKISLLDNQQILGELQHFFLNTK